jgi:hypothetical protein
LVPSYATVGAFYFSGALGRIAISEVEQERLLQSRLPFGDVLQRFLFQWCIGRDCHSMKCWRDSYFSGALGVIAIRLSVGENPISVMLQQGLQIQGVKKKKEASGVIGYE